jgi:hypothetical protein
MAFPGSNGINVFFCFESLPEQAFLTACAPDTRSASLYISNIQLAKNCRREPFTGTALTTMTDFRRESTASARGFGQYFAVRCCIFYVNVVRRAVIV